MADTKPTINLPILSGASGALGPLATDIDLARELAQNEKAAATRRAYASDLGIFQAWCLERGARALPACPASVAAFLASEAARGVRPSTIGRRVAALKHAHRLAGHPPPTDDERVKATVRGIRRTVGTAPRKKAPATCETIIAMAQTGNDLKGLRDRAVLLLGFAGAFRRSELVTLDCGDIEESETGLRITIRRSKTDQEGVGQTIAIVRGSIACPVAALKAWLEAAGITTGPLFRSIRKGGKVGARLTDQSVSDIVRLMQSALGSIPGCSPATRYERAFSHQPPSAERRFSR
jgi:site-specific recombinase XerC